MKSPDLFQLLLDGQYVAKHASAESGVEYNQLIRCLRGRCVTIRDDARRLAKWSGRKASDVHAELSARVLACIQEEADSL
jgi:hypothetical protein